MLIDWPKTNFANLKKAAGSTGTWFGLNLKLDILELILDMNKSTLDMRYILQVSLKLLTSDWLL
jgi:hypothetical protein